LVRNDGFCNVGVVQVELGVELLSSCDGRQTHILIMQIQVGSVQS